MTEASLFVSLDTARLAEEISAAERSVCYAAPGIFLEPAAALAELAREIGPELITVCLDFDERVLRMGFGTLEAVKILRQAGIDVRSAPGLRTGLVIIDDAGYIFTPTALYLEPDRRWDAAPNAMRLVKDQISEALSRLSPVAKAIAVALAKTEAERERLRAEIVEVDTFDVTDAAIETVEQRLDEAPPAQFDVARQVRVFIAYLQYVEISLTGASIQRHRLAIPASIRKLGGGKEIEARLRTTFDLIEKGGSMSSAALDASLNDLRKDFTRSLGKDHGRVLLKSAKPSFEERLAAIREQLAKHQEDVRSELQSHLDASRKAIVEYYVPQVMQSPPDAMRGQFLKFGEDEARLWLDDELGRVFPEAESLIQDMQLDVRYKDVTFETLSHKDFLSLVKAAFPRVDWDTPYQEFRAAGEKQK